MLIKKITTIKQLETLKTKWIDIYINDTNATVFSSWEWTLGWLKATEKNWFILAVYSNEDKCVSFALLRISKSAIHAGTFPVADHNSFIYLPEHKVEADLAINDYLSTNIRWLKYELLDYYDDYLEASIKHWSSWKYKLIHLEDTPCPIIELPDSWELYVGSMKKSSRKDILKSIRQAQELEHFNITLISEDTYEASVTAVLTLWQKKWGKKDKKLIKSMRSIFRECFLSNKLRVIVFWMDKTPIAANLGFEEPKKLSFYTYIGGFDSNYKQTSPGTAILANEIKYAISNGYKFFELLRGSEEYKHKTFKAKDRFNKNYIIENRVQSGLNKINRLFKQSIKKVQ